MQTFGFSCGYAGGVILDAYFSDQVPNYTYPLVSSYIVIPSTGTTGLIVYENSSGEVVYTPYGILGYNPIAARRVLTSATINGVLRTTSATPMGWLASGYS